MIKYKVNKTDAMFYLWERQQRLKDLRSYKFKYVMKLYYANVDVVSPQICLFSELFQFNHFGFDFLQLIRILTSQIQN